MIKTSVKKEEKKDKKQDMKQDKKMMGNELLKKKMMKKDCAY